MGVTVRKWALPWENLLPRMDFCQKTSKNEDFLKGTPYGFLSKNQTPVCGQDFARTWTAPAPAPEDRTPHPHRKTAPLEMSYHNFLLRISFFPIVKNIRFSRWIWPKQNLWFLGVYDEYWSPFVRYCKRLLVLLTWRRIEPKNKDQYDVNL